MNSFERIAGYEKEKEELLTLVEIFNNRKKYEAKGATLPKGIIFYGEAGTGKTLFADVLAKECHLKQARINLSDAASEGGICKEIRRAFLKAAKGRVPTMIFFDELDKVLPNEDEKYYTDRSKSILTQLLTLIDGMESVHNVVFVATCNNYGSLPESITRAGRFDKKISLGLPNYSSRVAILDMYINASPANFDMSSESMAKLCSDFSCAALKTLVNECLLRSDENNTVSEALIREKITEIKEESIPTERSDISYTVDATRNVGAFIVSRLYSNSGYVLSLEDGTVCNTFLDAVITGAEEEDYDDYDDYKEDEEKDESEEGIYSKNDYIASITALFGCHAAEEILLSKVYDNLEDCYSSIDALLCKMLTCGMLGPELACVKYRESRMLEYPQSYLEKINDAIIAIRLDCYQRAKALLERNKGLAEKLVSLLVQKKSVEKGECEAFIQAEGGMFSV